MSTMAKRLSTLSDDAGTVAYETEQADALLSSLDEAIQYYEEHPGEPFRETERRRLFHLSTMAADLVRGLTEKAVAVRREVDSIHDAVRSADNMGLPAGITPRDVYEFEKKREAKATANKVVRRKPAAKGGAR